MKINYKSKLFEIPIKKVSAFGKFTGLMFRSKNTSNLLFDFKKQNFLAIHSIFVFFSFLAIWLDETNKVIEYKIVKPFNVHICPKKSFYKLIEVPINDKNDKIIEFFVGKR